MLCYVMLYYIMLCYIILYYIIIYYIILGCTIFYYIISHHIMFYPFCTIRTILFGDGGGATGKFEVPSLMINDYIIIYLYNNIIV